MHQLRVRWVPSSYGNECVELELQHDGRGVQADVGRGRLQPAVVHGETVYERERTTKPGDFDKQIGEVEVPVEGELLPPALRVRLVDRHQLCQDLAKGV